MRTMIILFLVVLAFGAGCEDESDCIILSDEPNVVIENLEFVATIESNGPDEVVATCPECGESLSDYDNYIHICCFTESN